jgi:Holliday junction resolvase
MHKNKVKGTVFERRVVGYLKNRGYYAIRQGSSRFPDIIAIKLGCDSLIIECKINKYISKEEKNKLKDMSTKYGTVMVAYRDIDPIDKRKTKIIFTDLNYKPLIID